MTTTAQMMASLAADTRTREEMVAEYRAKHLVEGVTEEQLLERLYQLREDSDGSAENWEERLEIVIALDVYKDVGRPSPEAIGRLCDWLATLDSPLDHSCTSPRGPAAAPVLAPEAGSPAKNTPASGDLPDHVRTD